MFFKNCFDTSMTSSSISTKSMFVTVGILSASRKTPPSPPPITNTFFGHLWLNRGRKAIISWYVNSSNSVHWIIPSSTKTFPNFFLQKFFGFSKKIHTKFFKKKTYVFSIKISWYFDFFWNKISSNCTEKHWSLHKWHFSVNQLSFMTSIESF